MRIATIAGHATSTVKHPSFEGCRLLVAEAEGLPPQVVVDCLGAGIAQKVLISSDGDAARKLLGDESSPARWTVVGIVDQEGARKA